VPPPVTIPDAAPAPEREPRRHDRVGANLDALDAAGAGPPSAPQDEIADTQPHASPTDEALPAGGHSSVPAPPADGAIGATGGSRSNADDSPLDGAEMVERPLSPAPRQAGGEQRAVVLRPPSFGAVEARGLVKFYGSTAALRGCDLVVLRGERVALLGANGAGKTTLLKLLATLVRPSAGRLTLLGLDAVRQAGAVRRQLGVVAHETYLYRDLTAAENLRLYGRLYGVADLDARIAGELERVELADLAERRVGTLSRGQQQRLALGRALLHRPSLLLLDEPDTGLDEAGQALLATVVREAAPTVVLTSHAVDRALALADRVVVLAAGKVAYECPVASVDLGRLRGALGGTL
jgi:ABC-type multidrug transport system ATPase subunit